MEQSTDEMNPRPHRKNPGQDRMRAVICTILAFLLSLVFVGLTVLFVIQWSCFSRSSFYNNMASNNYYNYVQADIYDNAEAITLPTGISLDVLKDTIVLYSVHKDVNGYIDAGFSGETYVADTAELAEKLEQNVLDSLTLEGVTPSSEQGQNIKLYVGSIVAQYTDTVQMPLLTYFMKARVIYHKIFPIGLAVCILVMVIILIAMIKMHHWIHRGLRYIAYSTLAAALMTAIAPAVVLVSGFYRKIHLAPEYFYNFAMTYISNIFKTFLYFSVSWAIIAVIIMITIKIIKTSKAYRK